MRPKNGRVERSQPKTIPETSAPPAVDSQRHPGTFQTREPTSAPIVIAAPMNATSATSVGRSGNAQQLGGGRGVLGATTVGMSPRWIVVFGRMGISVAVAPV